MTNGQVIQNISKIEEEPGQRKTNPFYGDSYAFIKKPLNLTRNIAIEGYHSKIVLNISVFIKQNIKAENT